MGHTALLDKTLTIMLLTLTFVGCASPRQFLALGTRRQKVIWQNRKRRRVALLGIVKQHCFVVEFARGSAVKVANRERDEMGRHGR